MGDFTFRLKSSRLVIVKSVHIGLSTYLVQLNFGLSMYLDRTFAQRIGSAKVKTISKVAQCQKSINVHWLYC